MYQWIALALEIVVLIALIPTVAFGFYYGSLVFYYGFKLAAHRRKGAPLSWHDGWGIMRFGQFLYPHLLDDEGQLVRVKMLFVVKRFLVACASAIRSSLEICTKSERQVFAAI